MPERRVYVPHSTSQPGNAAINWPAMSRAFPLSQKLISIPQRPSSALAARTARAGADAGDPGLGAARQAGSGAALSAVRFSRPLVMCTTRMTPGSWP